MTDHETIRQRIFRCLRLDFRSRAKREIEGDSQETSREVVGRLSRGSVGAQLRDYVTIEDLERERREIKELDLAS